jgi:hypothetical protein
MGSFKLHQVARVDSNQVDDNYQYFFTSMPKDSKIIVHTNLESSPNPPSPSTSPIADETKLTSSNEGLVNQIFMHDTPMTTAPLPPQKLFPSKYFPKVRCEEALKRLKLEHETSFLPWCVARAKQLIPDGKKHSLNEDEILAILSYTYDLGPFHERDDNLYAKVNIMLASRKSFEEGKDYLWYLLSGLNKLPKYSGLVARGIVASMPWETPVVRVEELTFHLGTWRT